ncbi:4Fe-4S dicluster domain-containing protein [Buttiauxella sp. A111]|uniref:4Fe-4S dicluster domain-containing protein n=1 Tax=Buttiauxella sp. A111 TaxID=2563088 RepID=UPI0016093E41|nr:4Fe-4S dicluster domain-containing protein [Buttiauxella sp. A111]
MKTAYIHVETQRCIGCRTCEVSCAVNHQSDAHKDFSPRLRVYKTSDISSPAVCHQCESAPCASACPTGALSKRNGIIAADEALCIGCKSCIMACPFGAVDVVGEAVAPQKIALLKCDMCQHDPQGPACVSVCPTDALSIMTPERLEQLSIQKRHAV